MQLTRTGSRPRLTRGACVQRRAERETVFRMIERLGLARRTRGGAPVPSPETEGIS